jgi:hypothetical protein
MATRTATARQGVSEAEWRQYERDGYLRLGRVLEAEDLAALQQRIDQIMLGEAPVEYDRMLMQLDSSTGNYGEMPPQTKGFKGATLAYRKIQDLELDPLFLAYMRRPLFRSICARVYGEETPIACFRAMFMNKPAERGTLLPWHQDRWSYLDRDPLITLWTALDPATVANGCVQVIPSSHRLGVINPSHSSAFVTQEQAAEHAPEEKAVYLEAEAGEVLLLHNWLLHRSDVNRTEIPRRAFSVCYMDGRTRASDGQIFSPVF